MHREVIFNVRCESTQPGDDVLVEWKSSSTRSGSEILKTDEADFRKWTSDAIRVPLPLSYNYAVRLKNNTLLWEECCPRKLPSSGEEVLETDDEFGEVTLEEKNHGHQIENTYKFMQDYARVLHSGSGDLREAERKSCKKERCDHESILTNRPQGLELQEAEEKSSPHVGCYLMKDVGSDTARNRTGSSQACTEIHASLSRFEQNLTERIAEASSTLAKQFEELSARIEERVMEIEQTQRKHDSKLAEHMIKVSGLRNHILTNGNSNDILEKAKNTLVEEASTHCNPTACIEAGNSCDVLCGSPTPIQLESSRTLQAQICQLLERAQILTQLWKTELHNLRCELEDLAHSYSCAQRDSTNGTTSLPIHHTSGEDAKMCCQADTSQIATQNLEHHMANGELKIRAETSAYELNDLHQVGQTGSNTESDFQTWVHDRIQQLHTTLVETLPNELQIIQSELAEILKQPDFCNADAKLDAKIQDLLPELHVVCEQHTARSSGEGVDQKSKQLYPLEFLHTPPDPQMTRLASQKDNCRIPSSDTYVDQKSRPPHPLDFVHTTKDPQTTVHESGNDDSKSWCLFWCPFW